MTLSQKLTLFVLSLIISVLLFIQLRPEQEVAKCVEFMEQQFNINSDIQPGAAIEAGNLKEIFKVRCTYWVKNGQKF